MAASSGTKCLGEPDIITDKILYLINHHITLFMPNALRVISIDKFATLPL